MKTNLSDLWCSGIDDRPAVLHNNGRTSSRRELFAAAEKLSRRIEGKRIAIFCSSSELEAIAFLAVLRVSCPVIFPATNQPESLKEISDAFDILLTDEPVPIGMTHISLFGMQPDDRGSVEVQEKPTDPNLKMTFFTSGSTGKPKEIVKYFYQMDREIRVWEKLQGAELGDTEVHATVSHQHIYGLLFRLLWPLCSGRPFRAETSKNWEEISQQTQAGKPFILVTSPTHLSRLVPLEDAAVSVRPLLTFSAGGVLHNEFARQAARHLGRPVLEVYGSTETGAIAKRFNTGEDEAWDPLPGVDVSQNSRKCLQVRSSFLPDNENVFQTEDLVTLNETGGFLLLGRADRIVKVEGKRVSLPRMEELLRNHAWIEDVYTKMIGGNQPVLGAVVVLNDVGTQFLMDKGKFRTGRSLRDHLKKFEDAVTAPRRWRFLSEIPRNPQGKIRPVDIDALFEPEADNAILTRKLFTQTSFIELARETTPDKVEINFRLPADLDFFKGHFSDNPLLPGVVQLHWAVDYCNRVFGMQGQPQKIEKLKFKQFLFPENEAVLTLSRVKPGKIYFLYHSVDGFENTVEHSSGFLQYPEER